MTINHVLCDKLRRLAAYPVFGADHIETAADVIERLERQNEALKRELALVAQVCNRALTEITQQIKYASGPVAPGSENGAELGTAGDTSSVE